MQYEPDNWVIVKIPNIEGGHFYKVVAGWSGSYLYGDSWRVNSGITSIDDLGEYYLILGVSGSVYKCRKTGELVRINIQNTVQAMVDAGCEAAKAEGLRI